MDQTATGEDLAHPVGEPVATAVPPVDSRLRQLVERARPFLVGGWKVAASAAVTLVANAFLLLIAIPVGIASDQLFWSIAVTELTLFVGCAAAAGVLIRRSRSSVGAGLLVGWAAGYVGLIGLVVAAFVLAAAIWILWLVFLLVMAVVSG